MGRVPFDWIGVRSDGDGSGLKAAVGNIRGST